jgi:AraC family transcriptional activator of pobA
MKDPINVCTCNKLFCEKTLHPLVSVIDLSKGCDEHQIRVDGYAVLLRKSLTKKHSYGRKSYDFSDATLLFNAPDKAIDMEEQGFLKSGGTLLVFHPDLFCGNPLGQSIKDFTFFNYHPDEALHLSCCERRLIKQCLDLIKEELKWGVDKLSATIICDHITLLLHYCQRFYQRQFITRHDADAELVKKVDAELEDYLTSGRIANEGKPSASQFANQLMMSVAYFNDLLKQETGKEFTEYMKLKSIDIAKRLIYQKSDEDIATMLGFCSTACFQHLFEKVTGITTQDYRN